MKRSKRLKNIQDLVEKREYAARLKIKRLLREQKTQQSKRDQLQGFQQDYNDAQNSQGREGLNMQDLMQQRAFLQTVDKAVDEQSRLLKQTHEKVKGSQQSWSQMFRKKLGTQRLVERIAGTEAAAREKQEQSESNDRPRQKTTPKS